MEIGREAQKGRVDGEGSRVSKSPWEKERALIEMADSKNLGKGAGFS